MQITSVVVGDSVSVGGACVWSSMSPDSPLILTPPFPQSSPTTWVQKPPPYSILLVHYLFPPFIFRIQFYSRVSLLSTFYRILVVDLLHCMRVLVTLCGNPRMFFLMWACPHLTVWTSPKYSCLTTNISNEEWGLDQRTSFLLFYFHREHWRDSG